MNFYIFLKNMLSEEKLPTKNNKNYHQKNNKKKKKRKSRNKSYNKRF